jgi:hypothetical protein
MSNAQRTDLTIGVLILVVVFTSARLLIALAFLLATSVGNNIEHLDRFMRVITMDNKFTALRLAARPILDNDSETRSRMEFRGEGIVD